MRNPRGPVAVIGSHGICFAAMVNLAADGLFNSFLAGKPPERLGACWLKIQEGLAKGPIDALTFTLLDAVDGDSSIPQATQRKEHVEMFVLLGDPALRLPVLPSDCRLVLRRSGQVASGIDSPRNGPSPLGRRHRQTQSGAALDEHAARLGGGQGERPRA